ncbi:MAG: hypothetical protein IJ877_06510 [Candidatus Gastranaerophilales bacterium]|nr:hypothetical protein [Candidatus Gastranaerophilales bacterium]
MKLKKIFDLIYKDIISPDRLSRYRSLFNIIATRYSITGEDKIEKQYYLFNKKILERIDKEGIRTWKNKFYFKQEYLGDIFKKKYYKYYKNHDDIYIFWINSGEVFLFLKYVLHNLIKKKNSKTPLILTNRKYHVDMVKLFYPNIKCIYIKNLKPPLQQKEFKIEGYNFTLVVPKWHFDNVEKGAIENPLGFSNYFHPILDLYGCDKNNIQPINIKYSDNFEKSMLKKVKKTGLNLDNFIFLAPEAQSCVELDPLFWSELAKKFQSKGYDIFINIVGKDMKIKNAEFKNIFLSYGEVLHLCRYAKKIIALRSGICELLSETKVPMDILYTDFRKKPFFKDMNCAQVISAFGFKNLEGIDMGLINEYSAMSDYEKIYDLICN